MRHLNSRYRRIDLLNDELIDVNWYIKYKVCKFLEYQIFNTAKSDKIKKVAAVIDEDHAIGDRQQGISAPLFEVQQYVMDSYTTKVGMSNCIDKWTVGLLCTHSLLGTIAYNAYWTFDKDESKEASNTYKNILKNLKDISEKFVRERITTAIYWPTLKSSLESVDPGHRVSTNIPWINYSRNLKMEPDWRKNIYGNRYPQYSESNYIQKADYMKSLWPR